MEVESNLDPPRPLQQMTKPAIWKHTFIHKHHGFNNFNNQWGRKHNQKPNPLEIAEPKEM